MASQAELQKRAKEMRLNPTEPEKRLWRALSNLALEGYKFRRQYVVVDANAILDFFCPVIALGIEVDGDTHDADRDALRDARLLHLGIRVIRFSNADVMTNIDGVAQAILSAASERHPRWSSSRYSPPQPLP